MQGHKPPSFFVTKNKLEACMGSGWMDICLLEGPFHILLHGPVWEAVRRALGDPLKDVAIGPGQDGIVFHEHPKMISTADFSRTRKTMFLG